MRGTLRTGEHTAVAAGTTVKADTEVNGAAIPCGGEDTFVLFLRLDSTGISTQTIDFFVDFSPDGGTTWYRYDESPFTVLSFEDTGCATEIFRCYHGPILAPHIRLSHKGSNCTVNNYFTFGAKFQFYK